MDKKNTTSKILGFVSMALAIISIPMIFLPIISIDLYVTNFSFTIIDLLKLTDNGISKYFPEEAVKYINILAIALIVSKVLALISAVLSIFSKKVTRIISCIVAFLSFGISTAVIVVLFASELTPGLGAWLGAGLMLVSFVLALVASIIAPKNQVSEIPPIGGGDQGFPITPVIGGDQGFPISPVQQTGMITFLSGSCAGYQIPINDGEEIVIGKDPSQCSIVIDKKYAKVSRRHCGVRFDPMQNLYIITDYSTNGTRVVGGAKLARGTANYFEKGTTINLAGTENSFRLD
jgi:hypothetical protein